MALPLKLEYALNAKLAKPVPVALRTRGKICPGSRQLAHSIVLQSLLQKSQKEMCEQDYSPSAELISLILNWLEEKLIRNRTLISLVNCGRKLTRKSYPVSRARF
jgi:hypothetical protein